MYQNTWKLFAFSSLVLPILAAAIPVRREAGGVEKRANSGTGGRGTFYEPGLGSCGQTNTADQLVVAMSAAIINTATDCGQTVQITSNGITVEAQIVDTCPGCGPNDLDMSPALFQQFASLDQGVITIDWNELS